MAYTLQQLSDIEEIRVLKHRYFRGIDTADAALLADLFTDDIYVDYRGGNYRVSLQGKDNMMEFLANSFHSGAAAMHHGHMPEIVVESADAARGVWAMEDKLWPLPSSQLPFRMLHGYGHYHERYVRLDGEWRIAEITLTRLRVDAE